MSRHRSWSDLVPGLAALLALVGAATAVLLFARVGALHGSTSRIYAAVGPSRGLISGSEVWLGGQRIGLVRAIRFRPLDADTAHPLVLELEILDEARALVRRGAAVDVHPGGNLIGAPVVAIGLSGSDSPPIRPGDTLRTVPGNDVERARADFAAAGAEVPEILANVKVLGSQLRAARGTLGAFGLDGASAIGTVGRTVSDVRARVSSGDGTIGRALNGGALAARGRQAVASADSVRRLLTQPGSTSLGRFRRDSTLFAAIGAVRTELAEVARQMNAPTGSVGRMRQDSALVMDVARTHSELSALMADVKRHPLRYINASSF